MSINNQELRRNAIFYSGSNKALYNDLRRQCCAENLNLIIANNLGTLVNTTMSTSYSILFVDALTKPMSSDFLSFLCVTEFVRKNISVIIDGDKEYEESLPPNIFAMSSNDVVEKIPDIMRSVRVLELASGSVGSQPERSVKDSDIFNLLVEYGFDIKLDGFKYIMSSIVLFLKNGQISNPLCKTAYPIIASMYDTKPENVERNIRNAIKQASKTDKFKEKLSHVLSTNPTNSQVINYFVATQRERFLK